MDRCIVLDLKTDSSGQFATFFLLDTYKKPSTVDIKESQAALTTWQNSPASREYLELVGRIDFEIPAHPYEPDNKNNTFKVMLPIR